MAWKSDATSQVIKCHLLILIIPPSESLAPSTLIDRKQVNIVRLYKQSILQECNISKNVIVLENQSAHLFYSINSCTFV